MPEFDPDSFIKKYSQPAQPTQPEFDPDAFVKKYEGPSWDRSKDVATGLARGVTSEAMNVTDLVRKIPQVSALEKIARSVPTVDQLARRGRQLVRDFTDRPDRSNWEKGGRWAGMVAPYMLQPEIGLEALAARSLPTLAKGMTKTLGPKIAQKVFPKVMNAPQAAARGTERAIVGATAGAVQNPDDPLRGAEFGAAGGVAPGVAGSVLRSRTGQAVGGHLARAGASAAAHAAVSPFLGPGISIASSIAPWTRAGAPVHRAGTLLMDTAGHIVGFVPAAAGGVAAGAASGKGNTARSAPSE